MDVELHATSAFSFLRAASPPEDLVDRAADLGYRSVALLDHDGVYGAPRFYKAARARGLHAIVGAVLAVEASGVRGHLGIHVRNRAGYKNLCRLITNAKLRVSKEHARTLGITVSLDELAEHKEGLSVLLLAHDSPLTHIPRGQSPALAWARAIVSVFGRSHCAVEQGRHFVRGESVTMARLAHLAESLAIPAIASNDVRYAFREQSPLADVLTVTRAHTTLEAAGRILDANAERYLKPPHEMAELFRDTPALIDNARALAESCEFTLESLGYRFPEYPLPEGESPFSYLQHLVHLGARERYRPVNAKAFAQIARELALIAKLELAGYFLIVWDIVRFCRERGIMTQGRGSAANSAVCYALGITAVDPVGMELLFERFLSEERGEWPDIDLDLPSGDHREDVIQYVYQRYGERGAAMTANVITYRARSAMRESAKALGYPREVQDKLSKQLSWGSVEREDLVRCVENAGLSVQDRRVALLVDCAWRVQNLPRHLGQHSGGMVIAAGRLDEVTPLEPASMPGRVVVQWDKDDCADLGILKVDLLGLGMMALLEEVVPLVEKSDGVTIDLAHLPHDDPKTYAMMQAADTVGVFQIESRAQMATLPRMKPKVFYDLVVEVAIIRPGPIVGNMVHPYLDRRAGRAAVTYPHPLLEPILRRTLGIPLFQEQLMRVAMVAANFTGGEAEELRRAMGSKRSVDRMKALEQKLRDGMTANGLTVESQEQVIQGITSFALYGFPESHAASFALLAYASAFIKCHYPASFTCALLNQWPMGFYHPATVVKDAQRHGVRMLPVDVMVSQWKCTREIDPRGGSRGAVRLGMRYVSGLRDEVGKAIEAEREKAPFTSVDDLLRRTGARTGELATLAELGALAALPGAPARDDSKQGWTRRTALWQVLAMAGKPAGDLFARTVTPVTESPLPEMTLHERVAADYRASGLTVGKHPMALRRDEMRTRGVVTVREYLAMRNGTAASVAGAVITRQRPGTAKGFFFLTVEDETGIANAIVSPQLFDLERKVLVASPMIVMHGVVQQQDGVTSLKVVHAEAIGRGGGEGIAIPEGHNFR